MTNSLASLSKMDSGNILSILRQSTHFIHEELERTPLVRSLLSSRCSINDLCAFFFLHRELACALAQLRTSYNWQYLSLYYSLYSFEELSSDLFEISRLTQSCFYSSDASLRCKRTVESLLNGPMSEVDLGVSYVMLGSVMGGKVLAAKLKQGLFSSGYASPKLSFLSDHDQRKIGAWKTFQNKVNSESFTSPQIQRISERALRIFECFRDLFSLPCTEVCYNE